MAKDAVYGVSTVNFASPVVGDFPSSWTGSGTFSVKAIVKDSVSFNDTAPSTNDIEVEDMDNYYARLQSSIPTKGFAMDTYDMGAAAYQALMGFTQTGDWYNEPVNDHKLIKAVQIITRSFDEFPSKTFEWAKMEITVTRAGTVGKSGFPNFHLEFLQLANVNSSGNEVSGHRWKLTEPATYQEASINPMAAGWCERSGAGTTQSPYVYTLTTDTTVDEEKTYYVLA